MLQLEDTLRDALGEDWRNKFISFEDKPFAAASIGQVSTAVLAIHCERPHLGA